VRTQATGEDAPPSAVDDDLTVVTDVPPRDPPAWLLLAIFTVVAVLLTFPNLAKFRTEIPGDSGDSLLNLWIMRAVQDGIFHGWHAFWNAPIFYPHPDTLAYSETLLPVALLHWPLRLVFGDVVAFNLIYLGAWVLSSWCMYRLARRVVRFWPAAFVAALAFTYASIRLIHHGHFQLVVGGALVPLALLLLLRMLEQPSLRRGIEFGLGFAVLTLTASYYGAMMGVVVIIVGGGWLLTTRSGARRPALVAFGAAGVITVVLVVPIAIKYVELQRHPEFRRGFEPAGAAHYDDFFSAGSHDYVLDHVPFIGSRSKVYSRGIENRLFPGFVATVFGAVGVVVLAREARRRGWRNGRTRELWLVGAAGLVCLILSFGDWFRFDGHRVFLPFIAFRHAVPGFAGIRAVARLALGAELALVLFAAVGLDALIARLRGAWRYVVPLGLAVVVLAESAIGLVFVKVPTSKNDGGVDTALKQRPNGLVLELPIKSVQSGSAWPYVEAPRQVAALRDGDPRVNGYSGYQPKNFDAEATLLGGFPSAAAIAEARRLGVRYVVLRTALVGPVTPRVVTPNLAKNGVGRYDDATAQHLLRNIPPGVAKPPVRLPGGYLVELLPERSS
jgi:hypothetical protein